MRGGGETKKTEKVRGKLHILTNGGVIEKRVHATMMQEVKTE